MAKISIFLWWWFLRSKFRLNALNSYIDLGLWNLERSGYHHMIAYCVCSGFVAYVLVLHLPRLCILYLSLCFHFLSLQFVGYGMWVLHFLNRYTSIFGLICLPTYTWTGLTMSQIARLHLKDQRYRPRIGKFAFVYHLNTLK